MLFKKSRTPLTWQDSIQLAVIHLHNAVGDAYRNIHYTEQPPSAEMLQRFELLRRNVQEAHRSLELLDYRLKHHNIKP